MKTSMAHSSLPIEEMSEAMMRDAVWKSGYLLERRVASLLHKERYKVVTNRGFIDKEPMEDTETQKSREYDVYAYQDISVYEKGSYSIYPTLICECKNFSHPVVFFVQEKEAFNPSKDEVRVSGVPSKIWTGKKYISIQEFVEVEDFHHYCKPQEVPISTQCCTFIKDKGIWQADRTDKLHKALRSTAKALEYEINEDFKYMAQWFAAGEKENRFIDLSFYYPVVILQGDIYATYIQKSEPIEKDNLVFEKREHIQYNPEFLSSFENEVISYHMDVIQEKYLSSYLKIVDREMSAIKKILEQQKDEVLFSIDKIVKECKSLKIKPDTYRKYLEYKF